MVGVVLAAHGRLAEELVRAAEQIAGPSGFHALTLPAPTAPGDARDALSAAIRAVDEGDGVLVLTDVPGGSPTDLALTVVDDRVEVVTGVNLPMLLRLAAARAAGASLPELARSVAGEGRRSIASAGELLRARRGVAPSQA